MTICSSPQPWTSHAHPSPLFGPRLPPAMAPRSRRPSYSCPSLSPHVAGFAHRAKVAGVLPMPARPWGLTMVSSAAAQRCYSTSTASTDATRPTAATGLCTLLGIGPRLRRRQLVVSVSGRAEAWNPASDWPLFDSRSMAPSDWMQLWREGCRLAKGGEFLCLLGL